MNLREVCHTASAFLDRLAGGRNGPRGIALAAFLESSFLPFPFEALFIPAILSKRTAALRYASAALLGCLLASVCFYLIGVSFFDTIGKDLLGWLGLEEELADLKDDLSGNAFWAIFLASLLPFPLQAATLGSGALGVSFFTFLLAVALSRMVRFHGLALLVLLLGPKIEPLTTDWPWYVKPLSIVASFILVIAVVLLSS